MTRRLPSLTALRAFDAVARQKSFKDAAAELNVTTSAISHQIRLLESELECRLVVRGPGGFALSDEGNALARSLKRAFTRIGEVTERIRARGRHSLVLQVYSTFAVRWLLPRLPEFERTHPDIEIRIVTAQQDVDLSAGTVDACVMIGTPDVADVDYTYLFTSSVFPVCSPGYLDRHGSPNEPSSLAEHTLLQVHPSEGDWSVWLDGVGAKGVDVTGTTRFDSYDHALNSARNGLGIALAIEPFAEADLAAGALVEVFPRRRIQLPRNWYFARSSAMGRAPAIEAVRQWLLAEIASDDTMTRMRDPVLDQAG